MRRKTNREVISLLPLRGGVHVVEQALVNSFSKVVGHHVRNDEEFVKESDPTFGHL